MRTRDEPDLNLLGVDLIVDAMISYGLTGDPRLEVVAVIERVNASGVPVVTGCSLGAGYKLGSTGQALCPRVKHADFSSAKSRAINSVRQNRRRRSLSGRYQRSIRFV